MKLFSNHCFLIVLGLAFWACDEEEHYIDMTITSPAFADGAYIPMRHTCFSSNLSFLLVFKDIPVDTKSFALVIEERTDDGDIAHWVVWSIPDMVNMLDEGRLPPEAKEGVNSWGNPNYTGPCPQNDDTSRHKYYTTVWALDNTPELEAGSTSDELKKVIDGHIIGVGNLLGRYKY